MRISEFLLYAALIAVIVLAINQLQKPYDTSVVYVPSRWWSGHDNWGWGRRIGYNGHGWGCHGGCGGGGRGGRGGYSGHR